jgi:predicted pyridoxine 5'-phosphate oxidase superfamily flavin-nucleotide-binding protein
MRASYGRIAFTDRVRAAQTRRGSRATYARGEARAPAAPGPEPLTETERAFLAARDAFCLSTVGETGWPYVQHRGGPPGFLRVLDDHTLGWADFAGNRQYVTEGNVAGDDRVALLVMDHAGRRRLKVYGHARIVDAADDPGLADRLADPDYDAEVERAVLVAVVAFDWNCPQHITPRFTLAELAAGR